MATTYFCYVCRSELEQHESSRGVILDLFCPACRRWRNQVMVHRCYCCHTRLHGGDYQGYYCLWCLDAWGFDPWDENMWTYPSLMNCREDGHKPSTLSEALYRPGSLLSLSYTLSHHQTEVEVTLTTLSSSGYPIWLASLDLGRGTYSLGPFTSLSQAHQAARTAVATNI